MKIYQLYYRQELAMTIQEAWDFFSSPFNLNEITPDFFHVDVTSKVPKRIYSGLMICYSMKAVFGLPMTWLTEVSHCDEPNRFVYEQRIGPFKFWSHEVSLTKEGENLLLEDIVFYVMPLGWLGQLLNKVYIGDKLVTIFSVRQAFVKSRWGVDIKV